MPRPTRRPFLLGDLMVLVAAVAGGIALHRWVATPIDPGYRRQLTSTSYSYLPAQDWVDYLCARTPSYYAWCLTIGLAVVRWLPPRPAARRVLRQPGAVASLVVGGSVPLGLALHYLQKALHVPDPAGGVALLGHLAAWNDAITWASPAVLGGWAALAWSGAWAAERSWVDWAGRVLGVYWLAYAPLSRIFWPIIRWLVPIPYDPGWEP